MKRITKFLHSFGLLTVLALTLASCGADNALSTKKSSSSNLAGSGECTGNGIESPVCGSNNITYYNQAQATCHGETKTSQGQCICREIPVCGDDGRTYSECQAQDAIRNGYIRRIVKFSDCSSTSPTY